MAELTPQDVYDYTRGRIDDQTAGVVAMLDAAVRVGRRESGWHVTPVRTVTIDLDGPDGRVLWLPTLNLVSLGTVLEDDVPLAAGAARASAGDGSEIRRRVALRKRSGGRWTGEYSGIRVTMTHGFTEDQAADWRNAVLSMVDQMSTIPVDEVTGVSGFGFTGQRVDDVDVRFNPYAVMADQVAFSVGSVLQAYALPGQDFF